MMTAPTPVTGLSEGCPTRPAWFGLNLLLRWCHCLGIFWKWIHDSACHGMVADPDVAVGY